MRGSVGPWCWDGEERAVPGHGSPDALRETGPGEIARAGIAAALTVTAGVVEKHVANIFAKLGLPQPDATTAASSPYSATWNLQRPTIDAGHLLGPTRFSPPNLRRPR
jgi:hypothetical protein